MHFRELQRFPVRCNGTASLQTLAEQSVPL